MSAVYFLLLPQPAAFATVRLDAYDFIAESDEGSSDDGNQDQQHTSFVSTSQVSAGIATEGIHFSLSDKLALLKPLLIPFCLPLFSVYFAEYTINQGQFAHQFLIFYGEAVLTVMVASQEWRPD